MLRTIGVHRNTEKLSLVEFSRKYLAKNPTCLKYGKQSVPDSLNLEYPAVLVEHHVPAPPIASGVESVEVTQQKLIPLKSGDGGTIGVIAGYRGVKQESEQLRQVNPDPLPNFDVEQAEHSFKEMLSREGDIGEYAADIIGSFFKPATKKNLEWSLNGMESALTKAIARDKEKSVYAHVGGLKGYHYLRKAETIFPIHTEGGDLFSVNYNHAGAPKLWYCILRRHFLRARKLIRQACKGSISFSC